MIEHKYTGFICQKTTYKDNDAIFNVLTANGKKTFKARGILKVNSKNASSCNYFMISEFVTQSKTELSHQTLKTASIIKMYKKPYEDILISSSYLFICNLLDGVSHDINGYDIAVKCFDALENKVYPINVLNYFLKNLCDGLGYKPNIKGCISCFKKSNLISFDFESGGFICKDCFDPTRHTKLSSNILKDIYGFFKNDDIIEMDATHATTLFKMYSIFFKDVINLFYHNFDFVLQCI